MVDLLKLDIRVDGAQVDQGARKLDGLSHAAKGADQATARLINGVTRLIAAYASWQIVERTIGKVISETIEAEKAQRRLDSVVASTGGAAGLATAELIDLANSLQKVTAYGDATIMSAEGVLLTYGRLGREVFPQALEATLDMAEALGIDATQAAERVGKALDLPSRGMAALAKQGFFFTAQQKELVRQLEASGKIMEAQKIVLKELDFAYGGAARSARGTLGGALSALSEAWGDLFEASGSGSDRLRQSVEGIISTITDPAFVNSAQTFASTIVGALEQVLRTAKQFMDWFNSLGEAHGDRFAGVASKDIQANIDKYSEWLSSGETLWDRPGVTRKLSEAQAELRNRQTFELSTAGYAHSTFDFGLLTKPSQSMHRPGIVDLGPTQQQLDAAAKLKKAYDDIVLSIRQKVEDSQLEQRTIGMTIDEIRHLTNQHNVLQDAVKKGIDLDSLVERGGMTKRQALLVEADKLSAVEIQTRKLREEQAKLDSVYKAFGDTVSEVFGGGIKTIDQFFDHLLGGFAKIGQGGIGDLFTADGLQKALDSWGGAANDNGGATGVGKLLEDATSKGVFAGLGEFMKNNKGNITAGVGGLGLGYQSQNPLMGALGGAMAGAAAGPWGAVIGGLAGLVGGLFGMNEALEKAKGAVNDNRSSIDQFIARGMGKKVDEISVAVAQFKAQGAQLVEVAKAAGDTKLVAQLEKAMDDYRDTLKSQQRMERMQDKFAAIQEDAIERLRQQADAQQLVIDRTRDFIDSTKQFRQGLLLDDRFSPLNPKGMLAEAEKQFEAILKRVRLGDSGAQSQLQVAATSYLEAAQGYYGSSSRYQDIFRGLQGDLGGVIGSAQTQLSAAERQLAATTDGLKLMGGMNDGIKSLGNVMKRLTAIEEAVGRQQGKDAEKLQKAIDKLEKGLSVASLRRAS